MKDDVKTAPAADAFFLLLPSLMRLAQLQQESVDRLALQEAAQAALLAHAADPRAQLRAVSKALQVPAPAWRKAPDAAKLPALMCALQGELAGQWRLLRAQNAKGQWVSERWDEEGKRWHEEADDTLHGYAFASLNLSRPFVASQSPVYQLIRDEIGAQRSLLRDAVIGGLMINMVALATSFYSMQVYDRVIPTSASQTLLVLTLGVLVAVLFDFLAKRVRSNLYSRLIDAVDQQLARAMYRRFLAIRLDQLPQSVGSLASQMRGYETVRGFFTALTTSLLVDAPFALFFLGIIAFIAGPLAYIPLVFFIACLVLGWVYRKQVDELATKANAASNQKAGLLVESVEGAESIKSGQGGWRMLSRWMKITDDARDYDLHIRNISEHSQHLASSLQQSSYILMVAAGALLVSKTDITMGTLIACSILSGRVLSPVSMIPGQLVQWAHAKAALKGLDRLWALKDDHHGQEQPIVPGALRGDYRLEAVAASYGANKALQVPALAIRPGEKVGVMGPIGAGKTTLLRLLSGMYKPQEGRVLLDDLDLAHISKPVLAENLAYVQQEGRLFAGTLRENLILGLMDPGDEVIVQVARQTGLLAAVITPHPKGLQQEIFEGGTGLSGGQRQLVNLTRAFLRKPRIWLLDEPTASMDRMLELQVRQALHDSIQAQDTLVLVTHKSEMMDLVDRLIVVVGHKVVLDGPKAQVLAKLQAPPEGATKAGAI